jgi:hypothetical protein
MIPTFGPKCQKALNLENQMTKIILQLLLDDQNNGYFLGFWVHKLNLLVLVLIYLLIYYKLSLLTTNT